MEVGIVSCTFEGCVEIVPNQWGDAVGSFSNLLRDAKHLKVADFGLSLPKYDSASEYVGSNSVRSTESLRAKPPKGASCEYHVSLHIPSCMVSCVLFAHLVTW